MSVVKYNFPTEIYFGPKASEQLSLLLQGRNCIRPLVVTDRGLATQPIVANLMSQLATNALNATLFADIWGNPVESQVLDGLSAYRQHNADSIVAIGGGAAMDVAKVIGLLVNHPGFLFDYEDGKPDARPFDQPMPFLVALPTTSGTGSEVGRSAVISDNISHAKKIIFHPILLPKLVLADPILTLELPAWITAATGMDALSHLLESFVAKGFHPICDGVALEGIHLLSQSLVHCVKRAKDIEARGAMMNAAMMGAIAFQKGLGVTHSCAHALSTVCDLHHGLANGIMLPYAMAFNLEMVSSRFERIARAIDPNQANPRFVIDWLRELKTQIDIPEKLSQVGVTSSHIHRLVDYAFSDGCHQSNPRSVSKVDFKNLFEAAL
jgi:alcohol dehydrogenase class IV